MLSELRLQASGVSDSGGTTCCLVGPPGIGKSALARALSAATEGATTLVGRCAPPPSTPLRSLAEIAVSAVAQGADLETVDDTIFGAAVRSLLGAPADAVESGQQPLMLGEGLRTLIATMSSQPVICVVEDLHWADDETLAVLDYLIDHLESTAVLLLVTLRGHESAAADHLVRDWTRRRVARAIEVPALGRQDVAAMVSDAVGGSVDAEFIAAVAVRSEGNPLLVEEFVRESTPIGDDVHRSIPASYRGAVERRVAELPAGSRQLVQLAAIIGRDIEPDMLVRPGVSAEEAAAVMSDALRVQLAEPGTPGRSPVRFRHALTRDAVVDTLSDSRREQIATGALQSLETLEMNDRDLEVASLLADAAGDGRRASELLIEAARRAVSVGATTTALARLDAAADLTDADALHGLVIRECRVDALALAGRSEEALRIGERLVAELERRHDVSRLNRMLLSLARAAGSLGEWSAAADRLDSAFGAYEDAPASIISFRAIVAIELGDVGRASELATGVLDPPTPEAVAVCEAHEVLGRVARETSYSAAADHFRSGVEAATSAGLGHWRARSLLELGLCDATLFGLPAVFEQASEGARAAGAMALSAMCDYNLANLRGLRFEPDRALAAAERAIESAGRLGAGKLEALAWITAGQAHATTGARAKARLAGERAREIAGDDIEVEALVAGVCGGWAELLSGDFDASVGHYGRSMELLSQLRVPTATAPWYFGPIVLAAADHSLVPALRAQLDTPGFRAVPSLEACALLVDAIMLGRSRDRNAAEEALAKSIASRAAHDEVAASLGGCWHLASIPVAISGLADGWGDPVAMLRDAERWFSANRPATAGRWCATLLRSAGVEATTRGRSRNQVPGELERFELTGREYEVLRLLADRPTNRELADRLTISPATVKSHVERLLRKTGRRNRGELAELARAVE